MRMPPLPALCLLALLPATPRAATTPPFTQATFSQVVQNVSFVKPSPLQRFRAARGVTIHSGDHVATGADSRAELQGPGGTLVRVGANTLFSLSPGGLDLQQGCLLIHVPDGSPPLTLHTPATSAALSGSTFIVSCATDGGFKFLALDGKASARLPNGRKLSLQPGQLAFTLPGSGQFSQVYHYRLLEQTSAALLLNGFSSPLPSHPTIQNAVARQEARILSGKLGISGHLAGDRATHNALHTATPSSDRMIASVGSYSSTALTGIVEILQSLPPLPSPPTGTSGTSGVTIVSGGTLSLGSVSTSSGTWVSGGSLTLGGGASLSGANFLSSGGVITGPITLAGGNATGTLGGTLVAISDLTLDGATSTLNIQNVQASQLFHLKNYNFPSTLASPSISARTPVLENVSFAAGTHVNINSASGTWIGGPDLASLGGSIVPLKANFINSRYDTTLISGSGGPGTIPGTQVNIGTH